MNGKMKNICISGLLALSLVVSTFCYSQQAEEIDPLVFQLRIRGEKSAKAALALVKIGTPAVPALCKALENLDPSISDEGDAAALFGIATTLGKIGETDYETMKESVSCLLRVLQKTHNRKARALIASILSSPFFGRPAIPYIMAFLKSEKERKPSDNQGFQLTQQAVSFILIGIAEESPENAQAVLDDLSGELKTAKRLYREILLVQIANLAYCSKNVVPILEQALQSETDPDIQEYIEGLLEFAREKSR